MHPRRRAVSAALREALPGDRTLVLILAIGMVLLALLSLFITSSVGRAPEMGPELEGLISEPRVVLASGPRTGA